MEHPDGLEFDVVDGVFLAPIFFSIILGDTKRQEPQRLGRLLADELCLDWNEIKEQRRVEISD